MQSYRLSSYYGYGSGRIWLDKVECSGSEIQLIECPHREYAVCDYKDLAGVFCPSKQLQLIYSASI